MLIFGELQGRAEQGFWEPEKLNKSNGVANKSSTPPPIPLPVWGTETAPRRGDAEAAAQLLSDVFI